MNSYSKEHVNNHTKSFPNLTSLSTVWETKKGEKVLICCRSKNRDIKYSCVFEGASEYRGSPFWLPQNQIWVCFVQWHNHLWRNQGLIYFVEIILLELAALSISPACLYEIHNSAITHNCIEYLSLGIQVSNNCFALSSSITKNTHKIFGKIFLFLETECNWLLSIQFMLICCIMQCRITPIIISS